jgi:hypothetical protein
MGLVLCMLVYVAFPSICQAKYELSNWNAVSGGQYYKWLPVTWWSAYYLQEFDKVAPAPGADWMNTKTPAISPWFDAAREKGWVVKTRASEAKVGAIVICHNPDKGLSRLYIVKEVFDWGFKAGFIGKDGEPKEGNIAHSYLLSTQDGYTFRGYIWPERTGK